MDPKHVAAYGDQDGEAIKKAKVLKVSHQEPLARARVCPPHPRRCCSTMLEIDFWRNAWL